MTLIYVKIYPTEKNVRPESHSHRKTQVKMALWKSSGPTSCSKQVQLKSDCSGACPFKIQTPPRKEFPQPL